MCSIRTQSPHQRCLKSCPKTRGWARGSSRSGSRIRGARASGSTRCSPSSPWVRASPLPSPAWASPPAPGTRVTWALVTSLWALCPGDTPALCLVWPASGSTETPGAMTGQATRGAGAGLTLVTRTWALTPGLSTSPLGPAAVSPLPLRSRQTSPAQAQAPAPSPRPPSPARSAPSRRPTRWGLGWARDPGILKTSQHVTTLSSPLSSDPVNSKLKHGVCVLFKAGKKIAHVT